MKPTIVNSAQKKTEFCSALLQRMTLDEKVGQMVQSDLTWKQDLQQLLREGRIGSLLSVRDPLLINKYQHIAVDESRLGIPVLVGNDIIHGYRSIFPIPLALASSWDTQLIETVARASIAEALAAGTTWNFAPMVDISRDPRWGRIAESAGEDPYLNSQMARAWVEGYEGFSDADGRRVAACVKHYAAYGGAEAGKDYNTVDMSERRLREEYLPPYHAAVQAGVKTLMTSFNDLNGLPATANPFLLKQILRQEWGFDGVIISDYDSIGELIQHGFARDHKEAALRSVLAGVDIDMMGNAYHFHLAELVREGSVPESILDESVMRILGLKFELGLFEHPYLKEEAISGALMQPATLSLAEKAATESMVLLKNEAQLLPLTASAKKIALIGPLAEERASLMGCWSFNGRPAEVETLQEALQRNLPTGSQLITAPGCTIDGNDLDLAAVTSAANQADVIVLAIGERETMSGEAHSRAHLNLPGRQLELVRAVAASGKPVVGILFCGRPLAVPELVESVPALLLAWHGGTRAAQGVCEVLLGKVNPAGKLTATFPRSEGQIPVYYAHKRTGRPVESVGTIQFNEAHRSAYLDEKNEPLFPFGYGLSYTQFAYSDLQVETPRITAGGMLKVSAQIENTGSLTSREIVQLYIRDCVGVVTRPVKELKGFQKIELKPGEKRRVVFELPASSLAFLDAELHSIIEPGEFEVWIAPNSRDGLKGEFSVI
jgi:beta-glucosidase